jgi:hypothetical protein
MCSVAPSKTAQATPFSPHSLESVHTRNRWSGWQMKRGPTLSCCVLSCCNCFGLQVKESTENVLLESPKPERLQRQSGFHNLEQLASQATPGQSRPTKKPIAPTVSQITKNNNTCTNYVMLMLDYCRIHLRMRNTVDHHMHDSLCGPRSVCAASIMLEIPQPRRIRVLWSLRGTFTIVSIFFVYLELAMAARWKLLAYGSRN